MYCPKCGAHASSSFKFCEYDGTLLLSEDDTAAATTPPVERCSCGAGPEARDENGFCSECGRLWGEKAKPKFAREVPPHAQRTPELALRDHVEWILAPAFAAVSDLGQKHAHNQDDAALALETVGISEWRVMAVCDGVSSAYQAAKASRVAATVTREYLAEALRAGTNEMETALHEAIAKAHRTVCALHNPAQSGPWSPPAATIVAALAREGQVILGWVGDSRAYWIGARNAYQLTRDHSWLNAVVETGQLTEAEANESSLAHAITRCLGTFEAGEDGEVASFDAPNNGTNNGITTDGGTNNSAATDSNADTEVSGSLTASDAASDSRAVAPSALQVAPLPNSALTESAPLPEGIAATLPSVAAPVARTMPEVKSPSLSLLPPEATPDIRTITPPPGPGMLLLCTDGLWNYLSEPAQLHALLALQPPSADAITRCRALAAFANEAGGRDNVTIALAQWGELVMEARPEALALLNQPHSTESAGASNTTSDNTTAPPISGGA